MLDFSSSSNILFFKDDFVSKLKDHILSCLYQYDYDGDERGFTAAQRGQLFFIDNLNRVIESKSFRVNYTSYDIHRQQDFLRPGHGGAIMTLSRKDKADSHPFWYAQVLRAFIITFVHVAPDSRNHSPQTIEVLWVCWLGIVPGYRWGFKVARLPKVGFVPEQDNDAFRFLDPSLVIRRCHLIPVFSEGRTDTLLRPGKSITRQPGDIDDWSEFYVNMYVFSLNYFACSQADLSSFADRDMFTRFAGIGVGHIAQCHRGSTETADDDEEEEEEDLNANTDDSCSDNAITSIHVSEGEQEQEQDSLDVDEEDTDSEDGNELELDQDGDEGRSEDSDEGDFEF